MHFISLYFNFRAADERYFMTVKLPLSTCRDHTFYFMTLYHVSLNLMAHTTNSMRTVYIMALYVGTPRGVAILGETPPRFL